MSEPLDPHTEREIVDQIALLFEQSGYPPMMGRILAFLTVCDPPEQSSQDLANYLHASKGAVSQATRMLMQAGLIERVHVRNSRSYWFRLRENAWQKAIYEETHRIRRMREVAEAGLDRMAHLPASRRRRLQEFHAMSSFFEDEYPRLIERWQQHTKERSS